VTTGPSRNSSRSKGGDQSVSLAAVGNRVCESARTSYGLWTQSSGSTTRYPAVPLATAATLHVVESCRHALTAGMIRDHREEVVGWEVLKTQFVPVKAAFGMSRTEIVPQRTTFALWDLRSK